ncbi:MAG: hypothetical protein JWM86_1383 [Thermoleophilia bacterium]|nr:hypothetical protein [Thermoleophilia bacterium]
MKAMLVSPAPVMNRRARRAAAPSTPVATQTLPMRAGVAVGVSAPNWLWILGGAVAGALLLGPLGAIGGAAAGYLLVR